MDRRTPADHVLKSLAGSAIASSANGAHDPVLETAETLPGLLAMWCAHRPLHEPVSQAFSALVESGLCQLPAFGLSDTWTRFRALGALGAHDLELAGFVEGHANARAILEEAGRVPEPKGAYGLWTRGPAASLRLEQVGDTWRLSGSRPDCRGAFVLDHVLLSAELDGNTVLVLIGRDTPGLYPVRAARDKAGEIEPVVSDVVLEDVVVTEDSIIGERDFYYERPGYWHDATVEAAMWWGASVGIARCLRRALDRADPHDLAHFGAVRAELFAMRAVLERAAHEIDDDPYDRLSGARARARVVRHIIQAGAREVLARAGRIGIDPAEEQPVRRLSAALSSSLLGAASEGDLEALGSELIAQHLVEGSDFL